MITARGMSGRTANIASSPPIPLEFWGAHVPHTYYFTESDPVQITVAGKLTFVVIESVS
jgi:hypothetical protein